VQSSRAEKHIIKANISRDMGLNGTWTGEQCFITTVQSPCPSTEMLWTRNHWGGNYTAWTCVILVSELNNVHVTPLISPFQIKPQGQNSRAKSQMLERHVKISIWLLLAWDTNTSLFLQINQHGENKSKGYYSKAAGTFY